MRVPPVGGGVAVVVGRAWVTGGAAGALVAATPAAVAAAAAATPRSGAASGDASSVLAAAGSGSGAAATGLSSSGWTPVGSGSARAATFLGGLALGLRRRRVGGQRLLGALLVLRLPPRAPESGTAVTVGLGDDVVEHAPVGGAEEQHRGGPFRRILGDEGLAGAGGGLVDGEAVGQRAVELAGERRGGAVGDGELHRDDGGAVLLDQALRHPAERVGAVDAGGLAGVEQDQPQRVVVAQVGAEDGRADLGAAPVPVLEVDDAVLDPVVVVAVADEVQDVDVVLP